MSAYDTAVLASSPNFYYKMAEAASPLVDTTGNHNTIALAVSAGAVTFQQVSPVGLAIEWTGVCWVVGHATGGSYAGQSTTGPFSHEIVLKVPVAATGTYALIGWDDPVFVGNGWYVLMDASLLGLIDHTSQTNFGGAAMNDGSYHHCVVTYDGTKWTAYVDGTVLPTTITHTITAGSANLSIGGTQGGSATFTTRNGVTIGNWAGYNVVLSQAQVTAHYTAFSAPAAVDPTLGMIQPIVKGRFAR